MVCGNLFMYQHDLLFSIQINLIEFVSDEFGMRDFWFILDATELILKGEV